MKEIISNRSKSSLKELYSHRYVISQFSYRDIKSKYINTSIGYMWAIFNPLVTFLIYIIAFGLIIRVSTPEYNVDYYVILLCGINVWLFFNQSCESISNTLVYNANLLNKVYFPRMTLNFSSIIVSSIDFFISTAILCFILTFDGTLDMQSIYRLFFIPILYIGLTLISLGLGSILSILKMRYKDFRHLVPMLFQALFFTSPIVYTPSLVPQEYLYIYNLNPFVGYLELSRWIFISDASVDYSNVMYSLSVSVLIALVGLYFFNVNERTAVEQV